MKRIFTCFTVLALVAVLCIPADAVSTNASCAILMDADSGRILYEYNIHQPRLIASITKLMTALVAVEHTTDLDKEITIRSEWLGSEGSSIYLQSGEKLSMRSLLYGLLLQSGNDAAMAIACHVAGDMDSFAVLMNQKAAELGMKNSHFVNPSGLNDDDHFSTAYDMALLACACLKNEAVAQICSTRSFTVGSRTFYNHNKLLSRYQGCVGMKTGYTELAGRTLVSAATRNGQTLVCVTLNDGNDWNDHEKLLDHGFETFPNRSLCRRGDVFGAVKVEGSLIPALSVVASETLTYPLQTSEEPELTVELAHSLQAPVSTGMTVGWATWSLNGQTIAQTELVCVGEAPDDLYRQVSPGERIARWLSQYTLAPDGAHLV